MLTNILAMIFCGVPANTTKEDVLIALKQYSGQDKYVPTEVFISELKPFCLVEMNDEKEAAFIMTIIIRNGVEIRGCQGKFYQEHEKITVTLFRRFSFQYTQISIRVEEAFLNL